MRWNALPGLLLLALKTALTPLPPRRTLEQRLAMFPQSGWPVAGEVRIHWNEHQAPFIEADHDADLAFALGVVHGHLRLGQISLMRRVSQGRLSEMVGAAALDVDRLLRTLDFGRTGPAVLERMPPPEREWLERFAEGLQFAQQAALAAGWLPHEFRVLGLRPDPWGAADVLTIGRLAGSDINWRVWLGVLRHRNRPGWPALWRRLLAQGTVSIPSFAADGPTDLAWLERLLDATSLSGSNCVTLAPRRTATGGALIACDPHLGIHLPNIWLLAGYRSPSHHAVGMMLPGLPFIGVGRNPVFAWGGTNLHAASSDLFDVSALPPEAFTSREAVLAVRGGRPRRVAIRECRHGPVISDVPWFHATNAGGSPAVIALRWAGHEPSDDLGALVRMNRAQGWEAFREAMDGFSVCGQNFHYAGADGAIGQVVAAHLPNRENRPPDDPVRPLADAEAWGTLLTARALPAVYNPPTGFLASANNRAAEAPVPLGYFFSPDDRIRRFKHLLSARADFSPELLAEVQRDVMMESALQVRDTLLQRLEEVSAGLPPGRALSARQQEVVRMLADWDGHFAEDSQGALVFVQVVARLTRRLVEKQRLAVYQATWKTLALVAQDFSGGAPEELLAGLRRALDGAARALARHGGWGGMHRLGLWHPLGLLPLAGRKYRLHGQPIAGGNDTIFKTGHGMSTRRHRASYGSVARFISNLADPDDNRFVLLGGNDGWLGSTTLADQMTLWNEGRFVRMPLRPGSAAKQFPHHMRILPDEQGRKPPDRVD